MRKLITKDLGLFSKVMAKMDIKKEIGDLFFISGEDNSDNKELMNIKLGAELLIVILENYNKAENDFYKLLSSLSGKTLKQIEEQPINETIDMITQLIEDDSIQYFLKLAAK